MRGTCSNANDPPQDKPSEQSIRCGCSNEEECECSRRTSSAGHFIKHHPNESLGPQLNNADVGLLANVESERVNGHLLSLLTSSSSFQRSHQASKTTSQVSNKAECTSSNVNCNSSRRLIVRRNSNPNSGATIRGLTSCISNTPNLINSGTFTTLLFGSTPLRQFCLSQGLFGVPSNLFQSVMPGTRLPHLHGDSTFQLEEAPASFDDSGFPSENQIIDIWRQLLMESTLYIHRPADNNLLDGSSSIFRVTADNGSVDFRLNAEVVNQSLRYFSIEMRNRFGGMRLDVDNMSYEELLALEDHIGYVSTGLSEEAAVASLKRSNYFLLADENAQKEFCSICQEDFIEEDELGTLDCGHSFHICCIKQWLGYKNVCPICKSPGLSSTTFSNI
ncbi:hypothetical protein M0R45_003068 [Rubus argutus]|uniref:RING-type E3 ubiquitin transferase n=1 Tax=Rubus argutus TaxID=59490 RepID=A0AAW1YI51_RUBAR